MPVNGIVSSVAGDGSYTVFLTSQPMPELAAHDVRIAVSAAGVNRADIYQAQGKYPPPEGASDILGLEVSGTITDIGSEVRTHVVGDEVCALLPGGGYANIVTVPEWRALPVPDAVDLVDAAGIPEVYATVFLNLFELARMKPTETVLVHGGSSGIGTAAIQLVKALGGSIFVTAGSDEKCRFCESLGADKAINYNRDDFVDIVQELTQGEGVQIILDMVGGDYIARNFKALGRGGRMVSIACINGAKLEGSMAPLLMKHLTWMGSTLRSRSEEEIYHLMQSLRNSVWPLFAAGKLRTVTDRMFPLGDAQQAHDYMQSGQHKGKILLSV